MKHENFINQDRKFNIVKREIHAIVLNIPIEDDNNNCCYGDVSGHNEKPHHTRIMNKNIIIFVVGFILISVDSFSMDSDTLRCIPNTDSISKTDYYVFVDSMPQYPGGQEEMIKFFMTNFQYPQEIDACCRIVIGFVIDVNGKMTDLTIIRSLQDDFDKEALRVMRLMPDWKPGEYNDKPVPVRMTFPISIKLQ